MYWLHKNLPLDSFLSYPVPVPSFSKKSISIILFTSKGVNAQALREKCFS
jgi:hypothetical protein